MDNEYFDLISNSKLKSLTKKFAETPPDWEKLSSLFIEEVLFGVNDKFDDSNLSGILSELHLRIFLENESKTDKSVQQTPIPFQTQSGNYKFIEGRLGGYEVFNQATQNQVVEYDYLNSVDGLPVVWEVKMTTSSDDTFQEALSLRRVNKMLPPLLKYFRSTQYGYVVVVPKSQIRKRGMSSCQDNFIKMGGVIAPFYTNLEAFKKEISNNRGKLVVDWSKWSSSRR